MRILQGNEELSGVERILQGNEELSGVKWNYPGLIRHIHNNEVNIRGFDYISGVSITYPGLR